MKDYLSVYIREMKNRNYAVNTIRCYSSYLRGFLKFSENSKLPPDERISVFLDQSSFSNEQRRLAWSSIKLFYMIVLQKSCPYNLQKIRNRKRSPDILTRKEILLLLNNITNLKHRLIISMLYGSGLRVSEVCSLKVRDLDFENMKLRVRDSKGQKDRITLLSKLMADGLKSHIRGKVAEDYLFVTQSNKKYSIRTVQKIFSNALNKSGIQKASSCHTLRHSFATHLVCRGVDMQSLKSLLGHKSIKTTMVYVKMADLLSRKIVSPL